MVQENVKIWKSLFSALAVFRVRAKVGLGLGLELGLAVGQWWPQLGVLGHPKVFRGF